MCGTRQGPCTTPLLPVTYTVTDFDGVYKFLVFQVVESQFETCPEVGGHPGNWGARWPPQLPGHRIGRWPLGTLAGCLPMAGLA